MIMAPPTPRNNRNGKGARDATSRLGAPGIFLKIHFLFILVTQQSVLPSDYATSTSYLPPQWQLATPAATYTTAKDCQWPSHKWRFTDPRYIFFPFVNLANAFFKIGSVSITNALQELFYR